MTIQSVKLEASGGFAAVINGRNLLVPNDLKNRHRKEIQKWIDAGNTPDPVPATPPVPTVSEQVEQRRIDDPVIEHLLNRIQALEIK